MNVLHFFLISIKNFSGNFELIKNQTWLISIKYCEDLYLNYKILWKFENDIFLMFCKKEIYIKSVRLILYDKFLCTSATWWQWWWDREWPEVDLCPDSKTAFSAESSLTKSRFSEAFDFIPTRSFIICQYINSYKAKHFPHFSSNFARKL